MMFYDQAMSDRNNHGSGAPDFPRCGRFEHAPTSLRGRRTYFIFHEVR